MKNKTNTYFGDFKCIHCHQHISTDMLLSGVNNRNHCPYCLSSRHVDLHKSGDRLSACKARMEPVGLAIKNTNKKYAQVCQGELMLVHRCTDCGKISINRIAADDIAEFIFEIFKGSLELDDQTRLQISHNGVQILSLADEDIVRSRLFGIYGNSLFMSEHWMQEYLLAS